MLDDYDDTISDLISHANQKNTIEPRSQNPFRLRSAIDSFGFKEENKKMLKEEREKMRKMTLLQRTDALKPSIPPCVTQKTRSNSVMSKYKEEFSTNSNSSSRLGFEKHLRTTEFIQQTREIYIMQMVIDRKNTEIQRIGKQMKKAESDLIEREQKIAKESQDIKLQTTKCEVRLARARKRSEDAATHRVELIKQVKQLTNSVSMMNSEISKNEDLLDTYHRYDEFMRSLVPSGYTDMFDYFKQPSVLIEDMAESEKKNLLIIQACNYYSEILKSGTSVLVDKMDEMVNNIDKLNEEIEMTNNIELDDDSIPDLDDENQKRSDDIEGQLEMLIGLIRRTYVNCLNKEFNHNPIAMLEEIEANLHDLQTKLTFIDPAFVKEKQIVKDKERREKQRREKQIKQEIEQAKKMKQTLERANKPIKKKTGRPILGRTKLIRHEKKNDQALLRLKLEQQRIDKLLYGSPYE